MKPALKVTLVEVFADRVDDDPPIKQEGIPMSYAEAKEIALLRLELRACWARNDRPGALAALGRMTRVAGNDNELAAEVRRWSFRFA